ncbi:hypothetical protein SmJEL517_g02244 [Synchytrium microbalum]|uniref:Chaperone DnaJ n=1 Tax=Synchytrium microbalum TaxID=1806994 RepID=A0A507CBK8_9FUNG|nr:uncharacterized protein SmJEL517_g02244 [Synchytrium microbalum]TPX35334.1 hypothetical protein SmJEL517_g02244 [Synchytrium microbalum]
MGRLTCLLLIFTVLSLFILSVLAAGKDYYQILGLDRSASKKELKRAYKDLSKKYHPDKNPGDTESEAKFIELAQAYEVLTDDEKRRIYDQYGEEGLKQQGGGQHFHNPFDIFSQFGFGGGGFAQQNKMEKKGPEINMDLHVTLEELFLGTIIEVEINKQVICPVCRGSGAKKAEDVTNCKSCGGSGIKVVRQMLGPGIYQQMQQTCDVCNGKGKVASSKCPHCSGKKIKRGSHQLSVSVERGMPDGYRITFDGEADESPEYRAGDLHFHVKTDSHPVFVRQGDNLRIKEILNLKEALLGFERQIKHLDGKEITIERKGVVTQPGFVQVIPGQGMPHHQFPSDRGTLYVEYSVVFPDKLTDDQQKLVAKLFGS